MIRYATIAASALLVAACSGGEEAATDESPVTMSPGGQASTAPVTAPVTTPQTATQTAPPAAAGPRSYPVDLQANHPNGSVLRVTKVTLADDHVALDLAVTNGHRHDIELNSNGRMVLVDNIGGRYNPAAPPQDPDVRVAQGTNMQGTFVFLGRVNPAATSLTLTTNSGYGGENEHSNQPKFIIRDIPVQR